MGSKARDGQLVSFEVPIREVLLLEPILYPASVLGTRCLDTLENPRSSTPRGWSIEGSLRAALFVAALRIYQGSL